MALLSSIRRLFGSIASHLRQDHLWQKVFKASLATTLTLIIAIIPSVGALFGPMAFLAPFITTFGHCGQRFGQMVESLILIFSGTILGLGWALLGLYLSSLAWDQNPTGAYTIKALFVAAALIIHGYVRSKSPRLFFLIWLYLVVTFSGLLGSYNAVKVTFITQILYPILIGIGVLLLVNVSIFPAFSSSFLGNVTISTLCQTASTLEQAGKWFTEPEAMDGRARHEHKPIQLVAVSGRSHTADEPGSGGSQADAGPSPEQLLVAGLAALTGAKDSIRKQLRNCKDAFEECTYELTYSVLPPRNLKPISMTAMSTLVQNTIIMISSCESKFALMGQKQEEPTSPHQDSESSSSSSSDEGETSGTSTPKRGFSGGSSLFKRNKSQRKLDVFAERLKRVKPRREIATGDKRVLESLLESLKEPVKMLLDDIQAAVELVITCLAYCYGVPKLPSGAITPKGLIIEEVDLRIDEFSAAIQRFDTSIAEALATAALMEKTRRGKVDVMPRIETFLMSSFLLALRQGAVQILSMMKHSRVLVERRIARHEHRRIYLPRKIKWRRWLSTGGERDGATLPKSARRRAEAGKGRQPLPEVSSDDSDTEIEEQRSTTSTRLKPKGDEEAIPPPTLRLPETKGRERQPEQRPGHTKPQLGIVLRTRAWLADAVEATMHSEHLGYALKLSVAVFLASWPAFYAPFIPWFTEVRASWASLQLVIVFDVAIGTSVSGAMVRAIGVIYGCLAGYLAYEIGRGNLVALVVLLVVFLLPASYVHLGTPHVKTGIIAIVTMSVVALATVSGSGTASENFAKRLATFMAGSAVSLLVQLTLYPVKARDRLVESLSSCVSQISRMEAALAAGADDPSRFADWQSNQVNLRFSRAKSKAESALRDAETFLPFCLTEPRLKGSFRSLEPIYKEIIYVLHQIIDRMDNVLTLRVAYGSSVLEDLYADVYEYRRNVAASITLTLFAVNEALTTKLPLPQFLPSSRLAQLRLVRRVREVVRSRASRSKVTKRDMLQAANHAIDPTQLNEAIVRNVTRQKFLSWNASSAGLLEVIEYLEELVDLTKLLVGVNAFKNGMLERPSYRQYVKNIRLREQSVAALGLDGVKDRRPPKPAEASKPSETRHDQPPAEKPPPRRRRRFTFAGAREAESAEQGLGLSTFRSHGGVGSTDAVDATPAQPADKPAASELPVSLQRVSTRLREQSRILRSMTVVKHKEDADRKGGRS